jgi:hypothetical protein
MKETRREAKVAAASICLVPAMSYFRPKLGPKPNKKE